MFFVTNLRVEEYTTRSEEERSDDEATRSVLKGSTQGEADDSVGGFPTTPVSPLYGSSGLHPEVAKATSVPTRPTKSVKGRESKTERRGNPWGIPTSPRTRGNPWGIPSTGNCRRRPEDPQKTTA